jgi:UDP-N-acetyl-2-amino-2-deoxyglucuronate dehydrogenase
MDKVKFALAGCGRIGRRHAEHISRLGVLQAVCDVVPEKVEQFATDFECRGYTDIDEMLQKEKDIEVVSVCTPNGLHALHSISALRAGAHVLCEKPMATKKADAERMINEALRANRMLFVVKQNRFNPPVDAVKRAIDEGRFGALYSCQLSCFWNRNAKYYLESDWKGSLKLDGGTLYTQFSHFIDLLYWFFGDVEDVAAFGGNYAHRDIIEFEDSGVVALRFSSGMIGTVNYTVNSYGKNMEGSLTIFGEKGTVKIGGQYLNELEYQRFEDFSISDLPPGNPPNLYGEYVGSMSNHDKVYENILEVLRGGGTIATNSFEGLKTVEIIECIYKNISIGK